MPGCHGFVCVQGGGIKRHLAHFGYVVVAERFSGTCSLIFVSPVAEKLLEQSRLSSCRKYLDLQGLHEFELHQAAFSASNVVWNYICDIFLALPQFKITSRSSSFLSEKSFKYMSVLPVSYWSILCL